MAVWDSRQLFGQTTTICDNPQKLEWELLRKLEARAMDQARIQSWMKECGKQMSKQVQPENEQASNGTHTVHTGVSLPLIVSLLIRVVSPLNSPYIP